jgi:hypothetical protein
VAAGVSTPATGITLQENLLSVDVRDQDLRDVIETIASQGDIDVRHVEGLPEKRISVRFVALPLVDGLKRLFRTANLSGYILITDTRRGQTRVQRILFLPTEEGKRRGRSSSRPRRPTSASGAPRVQREPSPSQQARADVSEADSGSVFEDIKHNTTARRLLSQLVHPNEQVRERALERLIRLVNDDEKQAELLEFLEPLMEDLASDDKTAREEARAEIRKLLRR